MGNAEFAPMCSFSTCAGTKQIMLAILGKGLNVRSLFFRNQHNVCLQIATIQLGMQVTNFDNKKSGDICGVSTTSELSILQAPL